MFGSRFSGVSVALCIGFLASGAHRASAEAAPTFAEDVAPIFFDNCAQCHRPGEIAPMSLLSYEDARPWAKSIKTAVATGEMPPWKLNPAHGDFANDISLTESEIATIVAWVDAGAPAGNPGATPPVPSFPEGWRMGEPDHIIDVPEITIPAEGPDQFVNIDVPINLPEDRWVRAVEVQPGNRQGLHHVVIFVTGGVAAREAVAPDFLAVWALGTPPNVYGEGMGRELRRNASLRLNMHYHSYGMEGADKTRIGLYFGEGELEKVVTGQFAGTVNFAIPPGAEDHQIDADYFVDEDIRVTSFFPHMHMRGKSMIYTAYYPDGRSEVLLDVPDYDFNWQWFYYPREPIALPEGTRLHIEAHYDNSESNPSNPDPTIRVTFGEESTNEMMFGAFEFIAEEGRSVKPVNPREKIERMLVALKGDDRYKVNVNLGFAKMPTAFVLPRIGDGTWYFPFGRQVFELPLNDIQWEGENFTAAIGLFGQGGITISGTVTADGAISGEFHIEEGAIRDQDGFNPQGFEGLKYREPRVEANAR